MYLRHGHHSHAGALTLIGLGAFLLLLSVACFRSAQQYGFLMQQRSASSRRWLPERFYSARFFTRQIRIFGVLGAVVGAELILLGVMLLIHD
jgi:hypothetical protein